MAAFDISRGMTKTKYRKSTRLSLGKQRWKWWFRCASVSRDSVEFQFVTVFKMRRKEESETLTSLLMSCSGSIFSDNRFILWRVSAGVVVWQGSGFNLMFKTKAVRLWNVLRICAWPWGRISSLRGVTSHNILLNHRINIFTFIWGDICHMFPSYLVKLTFYWLFFFF